MKINNIETYKTIAKLVQQAFHIPVYIYHEYSIQAAFPVQPKFLHPPVNYLKALFSEDSPIYFTAYGTCFAKIAADDMPDMRFVIGPVSTLHYDHHTFHHMYRDYVILESNRNEFCSFFQQIPNITYVDFFYDLLLIFYMINRREISLSSYFDAMKESSGQDEHILHSMQAKAIYQSKESEQPNNSYALESSILSYIKTGDINGIKQFISNVPPYQAGIVAVNNLRLQKNYFISTLTLVTRAAIEGGMPKDAAYQLSDLYISQVETLDTIADVNALFMQGLNDFVAQVNEVRQSIRTLETGDNSLLIRNCMDYIHQNTNKKISVQDVANALGYNRSYVSAVFSKELGFHLGDYIYRCKLEEGKSLLTYTDKSISEISTYLCFSSQSHFQMRFRKTFGITPAAYRKKYSTLIGLRGVR